MHVQQRRSAFVDPRRVAFHKELKYWSENHYGRMPRQNQRCPGLTEEERKLGQKLHQFCKREIDLLGPAEIALFESLSGWSWKINPVETYVPAVE